MNRSMPASMQKPAVFGTQRRQRALHLEAASVVTAAFPTDALPHARSRYAISRARNGDTSNPLYRLSCWFEEARDAGLGSRSADVLIAYLSARRDEVWCNERLCFIAESYAEQLLDGDEDVLQQRALVEPVARRAYGERLIVYIAQLMRVHRSTRQENA